MPRMVLRAIMHEIMKVIAPFPLGETMAWLLHTFLQGQRGPITGTSVKPRGSGRGYKEGCLSGSMP
jgi:hypothetical protein